MADFIPPAGPPPPKVPEGWTARWNDQYKEWFYVNLYTKQSQWEKPTEPVYPPGQDGAPPGPPPGYQPGASPAPTDAKTNPFHSPTPENGGGSKSQEERDAELARRLQEEENTRAVPGTSPAPGGAASSFYGGQPSYGTPTPDYSGQGGYGQPQSGGYSDQLPPRPEERGKKSGGLLGKIMNKVTAGKQGSHGGYGGSGGGGYGGGYPQQSYGGGGMAPGMGRGYGGGMPYGGQGMPYGGQGYGYSQQPPKKSGGGMGAAGGAALGLGAGLIGGALIADAIDDHEQEAYQDGYQDGANNDFDDGGGGDFDF